VFHCAKCSLVEREALIVEDDTDGRRLVAACLRRMGFHAHEVKDGAEAVTWLQRATPDLVCLDLRLPDCNGLVILESMRANERLCDVPVLVISALTEPAYFLKAEEVGADEYLVKPFRTAELLDHVRELVGRSELSAS